MNKFTFSDASAPEPIVFEQVFGEKPGGGLVGNPTFDVPTGTAVGKNSSGVLTAIKCYKLVKAVAAADTTMEIAKGSGVAVGDFIAHGTIAKEVTALNTTGSTKDVITVTMGIDIANGTFLYQSATEGGTDVAPVAYGYYDADAETEGAKVIVADEDTPEAGEIKLSSVDPYHGIKNLAVGDYVLLKTAVEGVDAVQASPIYTPLFLTGAKVYTGKGDQAVKLINGAVVRKETVNASDEVLALMKTINAV